MAPSWNFVVDKVQEAKERFFDQKIPRKFMVPESPLQVEIQKKLAERDDSGHGAVVIVSTNVANKETLPPLASRTSESNGIAVPLLIPPNTPNAHFLDLKDQSQVGSYIQGLDNIVSTKPDHKASFSGILSDPRQVVYQIWNTLHSTFGYIIWNYEDFVRQFQAWDGSLLGLMTHIDLMWRTMVTVVITLGILELGPLIDGLSRILMEIGEVIVFLFRLVETTASELWYFLGVLWKDAMIPVKWIMSTYRTE